MVSSSTNKQVSRCLSEYFPISVPVSQPFVERELDPSGNSALTRSVMKTWRILKELTISHLCLLQHTPRMTSTWRWALPGPWQPWLPCAPGTWVLICRPQFGTSVEMSCLVGRGARLPSELCVCMVCEQRPHGHSVLGAAARLAPKPLWLLDQGGWLCC